MYKKKAVAVLLAAAFSLGIPLSSMAEEKTSAPTPGTKGTHTAAKSQQAIASRKAPKKIAKKPVKRTAHGSSAKTTN